MRTTLSIDDDILCTAKALAAHQRRSVGEVVSEMARKGMARDRGSSKTRNGFPVLPRRGTVVTLELVNALRDDEE
jgi:hypothetical protein